MCDTWLRTLPALDLTPQLRGRLLTLSLVITLLPHRLDLHTAMYDCTSHMGRSTTQQGHEAQERHDCTSHMGRSTTQQGHELRHKNVTTVRHTWDAAPHNKAMS